MDGRHHHNLLLIKTVSLTSFSFNFHSMPSSLDSLPVDALVQILCKLKHDELKLLPSISKSFRQAALIAQRMHFNFSTPEPKRMTTFTGNISISAPGAPLLKVDNRRKPRKSKMWKQENQKIAVVLFPAREREEGGFRGGGCHAANERKDFVMSHKLHA